MGGSQRPGSRHGLDNPDTALSLIKSLFSGDASRHPDEPAGTLTVRLLHQPTRAQDLAPCSTNSIAHAPSYPARSCVSCTRCCRTTSPAYRPTQRTSIAPATRFPTFKLNETVPTSLRLVLPKRAASLGWRSEAPTFLARARAKR